MLALRARGRHLRHVAPGLLADSDKRSPEGADIGVRGLGSHEHGEAVQHA